MTIEIKGEVEGEIVGEGGFEGLDVPDMGVIVFQEMLNQNINRSFQRFEAVLLFGLAAFFRFSEIGLKPPHFDEGINGHFVMTMWKQGFYSYDPTNFHGPLYFYLCQIAEVLLGRSIEALRQMTAVISMLVVYVTWSFRRYLGRTAIYAAWILALSPAFTFYGRYAIHETLFTLGELIFVYGRFAWMGRPSRAAAAWMATGFVILISTKETFVIFFVVWLIAEFTISFLERHESLNRFDQSSNTLSLSEKQHLTRSAFSIAGIAVFATAALYSGFFERIDGLTDFFRAFTYWSKTGTAQLSGHEKPFFYWIELLYRYEWPLLIGLIVSVYAAICLRVSDRKLRILLLSGFGQWLAYSLIPYKTPWLVMSFWPLAFSVLPEFSIRNSMKKSMRFFIVLVIVAISVSSVKAWQLSFEKFAPSGKGFDEPYVYVQTTTDYTSVMNILRQRSERHPEAKNDVIVVLIQDSWPLPYELSLYPKLRFARLEDIVKDPLILRNASLALIDGVHLEELRKVLPKPFAKLKFQLRDAYLSGWALFDVDEFRLNLPEGVEIESQAGVQ